ncbi:LysR substrate-binding domain-containing protein, partial [Gilvimarinus sp. 1_MG-2023]
RQLLEDGGEPSGRVVLGMSQPTGNALAVPLFAEVNRRYPSIELDLQTGLSSSLYQLLRQGDVDLLVSSDDASPHMGMISRPLLNERLFLAVGTGAT